MKHPLVALLNPDSSILTLQIRYQRASPLEDEDDDEAVLFVFVSIFLTKQYSHALHLVCPLMSELDGRVVINIAQS
jgi:hypothetical protein